MKKTNDSATRWWSEDKGFYMVLLLCVLAVAVAAYVLFASPDTEQTDPLDGYLYEADDSVSASESLERIPAMDTTASDEVEVQEDEDSSADTDTDADADVEESAVDTSESEEEQVEETIATLTFTPPIATDVSRAFSGDTLEYDETTCDWRTHDGVDYAGEQGDAVCAIADGTVTKIGEDAIYGKYVILSHAQNMSSLYAGLDEISVEEGDTVTGGTQFAVLGDPMPLESAQGVHLHLVVTKDDETIDPTSLF